MQLVEQGKIDLDADVNQYLDFKIPPYQGKPITMRNLMTHTPGFEEAIKGGIRFSGTVPPLSEVLKSSVAGTGLCAGHDAGLLQLRRRGRELYRRARLRHAVCRLHRAQHIRATRHDPLLFPSAPCLRNSLLLWHRAIRNASVEPKPYELISIPGAGSLAISAADMAKFMIAHLNQGAGLMKPETAQLMHDPSHVTLPGTDRMALGFYEMQLNGLSAIGHGGDLNYFHSDMWIYPTKNVGLFISMNSAGEHAATELIRIALFEQFGDRYFPSPDRAAPVELPTAKEHARMLAGSYISSRGFFTNFIDVQNFVGQVHIGLDKDGRPLVPAILGGDPKKWIEVEPFVWQDAYRSWAPWRQG